MPAAYKEPNTQQREIKTKLRKTDRAYSERTAHALQDRDGRLRRAGQANLLVARATSDRVLPVCRFVRNITTALHVYVVHA